MFVRIREVPSDPWLIYSAVFSSTSRLLFVRAAVLHSPPTVARAVRRGNCRGEILSCLSSRFGGLGNGPRVTGSDLADHSDQHVFFRRQDLVAARGGGGGRGIY